MSNQLFQRSQIIRTKSSKILHLASDLLTQNCRSPIIEACNKHNIQCPNVVADYAEKQGYYKAREEWDIDAMRRALKNAALEAEKVGD